MRRYDVVMDVFSLVRGEDTKYRQVIVAVLANSLEKAQNEAVLQFLELNEENESRKVSRYDIDAVSVTERPL